LPAHDRRTIALRGGVEAGLVGAATLLLIRITVASLFALAAASLSAVVKGVMYLLSSTPSDDWMMRLARSPVWLALKVGAYPFLGDRALDPGFDLRVILFSTAVQVATSVAWGVVLGLAAAGRAASAAVPLGLLVGIAAWFVNGYFLPALFAGGQLAGSPALLIEYIPFGLVMGISFFHHERAHVEGAAHPAPTPHHWFGHFHPTPAG
jgi:hypothetical protein